MRGERVPRRGQSSKRLLAVRLELRLLRGRDLVLDVSVRAVQVGHELKPVHDHGRVSREAIHQWWLVCCVRFELRFVRQCDCHRLSDVPGRSPAAHGRFVPGFGVSGGPVQSFQRVRRVPRELRHVRQWDHHWLPFVPDRHRRAAHRRFVRGRLPGGPVQSLQRVRRLPRELRHVRECNYHWLHVVPGRPSTAHGRFVPGFGVPGGPV